MENIGRVTIDTIIIVGIPVANPPISKLKLIRAIAHRPTQYKYLKEIY